LRPASSTNFADSGARTPGLLSGDQQHPEPRLARGVQAGSAQGQTLLQEALKGAATQKKLVLSRQLPDHCWAGSEQANFVQQTVDMNVIP